MKKTTRGTIHGITVQKGGVGKSTIASMMAYEYAVMGYKTILVDFDPQSTQTSAFFGFSFGSFTGEDPSNIANIFSEDKTVAPIKHKTVKYVDNPKKGEFGEKSFVEEKLVIDFIPSNYELTTKIESSEYSTEEKIDIVQNFLDDLRGTYDKIIVDSPPAFGVITKGILRTVDSIIIPVATKSIDTDGMIGFFKLFDHFVAECDNINLKKMLVVPNMYQSIVNDSKETLKDIAGIPNLVQAQRHLRNIDCEVAKPIKQSSVVQTAPSYQMFLVPYIMDYTNRSQHKDLLKSITTLATDLLDYEVEDDIVELNTIEVSTPTKQKV